MKVRRAGWAWIALLVMLAPLAQAATPSTGSGQGLHAFLDRSHVSLGDTVTLNIQSTGSLGDPDLSPLNQDFEVLGASRSSSVQVVNGQATRTSQLGIALKPLHAGTLTIPALTVGGATTQALTLKVGAAPSGGTGKVGDPVFMEADVQSSSPWMGQQTVYTVRLFYLPGVDGALGDPTADGARLIQLDRDHRYVTQREGYTYKVIERSWALIPQRSGTITVQGPVFQGQRMGPGFPNAWFNHPNALLNAPLHGLGGSVHAVAPVARIDARAPPANAGKPWLPARGVQLKLSGLPANGEVDAGTPLTVTLTISASGQPADALPEPELPPIAGARVYPDQPRDATDDGGQWLQGKRTRSFAIVPERNGKLTIPAITLDWWSVEHNRSERARTSAHTLAVSGVAAGSPAAVAPSSAAPAAAAAPGPAASANSPQAAPASPGGGWRDVALASLALWVLLVLGMAAWWLSARRRRSTPLAPAADEGMREGASAAAVSVPAGPTPSPPVAPAPPVVGKALQRLALNAAGAGDAAECERALLAWARASRPGVVNAGALREALADPAQRTALDELEQARWKGGDAASACARVAQAFASGFDWRNEGQPARVGKQALPPLYPSP